MALFKVMLSIKGTFAHLQCLQMKMYPQRNVNTQNVI